MTRTPVLFIHGAWLHALSWESWTERFAGHGYTTCAPGWPDEPPTAREARERPDAVPDLGLDDLVEHFAAIARSFDVPPVIIGHSVGGLVAQHLIGARLGQAAVAIAPAPINDIAVHTRHRSATGPDLLSAEQFREVFANAADAGEAQRLYDRYAVPVSHRLLDDLGCGGRPRRPSARVDTGNTGRGPLLLVSGQEDLLVPDHVTRTVYKEYGDSTALTDLKQFADRGHSLVIDSGWRFVADHVLGWLTARGIRPTEPGSRG
ncbi:alpha/beta hydrolase [Kitasatospora sp. NPDC057223]|uniref:alpha/beta hydrolase n=1 Tax=Kitasatospora sp. NPDC057223 TaxID=3346055 RepID=UPI003629BECD